MNVAENVLDMLAWGFGLAFIVLGSANLARALRRVDVAIGKDGNPDALLDSAHCLVLGVSPIHVRARATMNRERLNAAVLGDPRDGNVEAGGEPRAKVGQQVALDSGRSLWSALY